jgi:glycosyltransferase involved in cell wall biosynthesis
MVAGEGMINGIPVIYNPTPGLIENVGDAGICINRKDTEKWASEINNLMTDDVYYKKWSKKGLKRADQLKPKFKELEDFICK